MRLPAGFSCFDRGLPESTAPSQMKWLSAGLTFVNLSVVCGLLLGMASHGLNPLSASLALVCGVAFAIAAWLGTSDPDKQNLSEAKLSKRAQRRLKGKTPESAPSPWCY